MEATLDFVPVFVPRAILTDVYEYVAKRSRQQDAVPQAAAVEAAKATKEPGLDEALVRRMYNESHAAHRKLIQHLAANPDRWMYTSEIATDLGLTHGARSLAGMLGAFGRRAAHRYAGRTPWRTEWDAARGEARHTMPSAIAEIVRAI
jgi:hypothetical protein